MSYWEKRQEQKYLAGEKKINDYYKGLEKSFEQAKKEIQIIINDFYMRYARENELTYVQAQRALNTAEIGDLKSFISKVNANMGEYNLELNNMSIKARITRYEALQKQIDATLQQLYSVEYQHKGEDLLKDVYLDSYYRTWFNIDQYKGFHAEFAQVSAETVEELIKYPFNGADFSTRIWKQKDHMLQGLNESITTMLIQGRNPMTLSKDFAKKFGTKEFEAYRLLHTEGSFMIEQGTQAGYIEDGVEKYEWLATLDTKTCDDCAALDGKKFDVGKGVVGITLPPLHQFDRCTTIPYYDDDVEGGTRTARSPDKKTSYTVPANTTYKQWHEKYIESNPEALLSEKKWKNRHSDKKQHEDYKNIFGSDMKLTFNEFQRTKYTNDYEYGILKAQYKGMGYYYKAAANEPEITKNIAEVAKTVNTDALGLEHRIKSKDSYLRKIRSNYDSSGNDYEINDILRYTYGSSVEKLADTTNQSIDTFSNMGYNTIKVKNTWLDERSAYKGINTTIQAANGQKFELQYHTKESFDLKNGKLHELYEKQRLIPDTESEEFLNLQDQMFELSDSLTTPKKISEVKNK
ncbi:MAG: minor capsid protein [Ruminiclostridium sp.]